MEKIRPMFVRRRAVAEEKLLSVGSERRLEGGADPVAEAVVRSLDAKLESIDDLIARLEIEEGQVGEEGKIISKRIFFFFFFF